MKKESSRNSIVKRVNPKAAPLTDFDQVVALIDSARTRAYAAVNTAMIDLYWSIGEHISRKIAGEGWGKGTVQELARYIERRQPGMTGFSPQNLWRMRQFYDTYCERPKLAALLRELPWTHNLLIMGQSKRDEEREFYLKLAHEQKWTSRELERQLNAALFERTVLSPVVLSAPLRELYPDVSRIFKDTYLIEFLKLPGDHSEADLHRGLVAKLKDFLIELGRDFCFVGSHYPIQVGGRDFELDLLFFNRSINCLVAIELKIGEFQPEHLGKLQFYLEALDRNMRKPHEQPSVGVLLCANKDREVVEFALSRSMSPAVVAEYQTHLPDKKLLQEKLHEFYTLAQAQAALSGSEAKREAVPKKRNQKHAAVRGKSIARARHA